MFLMPVLKLMAEKQASDLFVSAGTPMSIKIQGTIMPVNRAAATRRTTAEAII